MQMLTIQLGGSRGCLGLRLHGSCTTATDAHQLEQATQRLQASRTAHLWIDCQQLLALSELGQRALLQADRRARAMGTTCYWCGLPEHLLDQLADSGLYTLLCLLPAEAFRGPRFLQPRG